MKTKKPKYNWIKGRVDSFANALFFPVKRYSNLTDWQYKKLADFVYDAHEVDYDSKKAQKSFLELHEKGLTVFLPEDIFNYFNQKCNSTKS